MADAIAPSGATAYVGGLFADEAAFVAACRAARAAGHRDLQAWTPWPVHGLEEILGLDRSPIGRIVLAAIVLGLVLCAGFIYHLQVEDWPVVYGGKPYATWQLWVVPVLETGLLLGAVANLLACFQACKLMPDPFTRLPDPRLTDDRFCLAVPVGADPEAMRAWLRGLGAVAAIDIAASAVHGGPRFVDLQDAREDAHA